MSHTPLKMTVSEAHAEVSKAWHMSYSPSRNEEAIRALGSSDIHTRAMHLVMRLFFRGIYVPQMTKTAWLKLIVQNRRPISKLVREGFANYRELRAVRNIRKRTAAEENVVAEPAE